MKSVFNIESKFYIIITSYTQWVAHKESYRFLENVWDVVCVKDN